MIVIIDLDRRFHEILTFSAIMKCKRTATVYFKLQDYAHHKLSNKSAHANNNTLYPNTGLLQNYLTKELKNIFKNTTRCEVNSECYEIFHYATREQS